MKRAKAVITVFMALISVLFMSLAGALIDSARMRGAMAQAAVIEEMGNYSIFGEFENTLLEEYEVFGLDGGRGTGDFAVGRIEDALRGYLLANASPSGEVTAGLVFDPWKLRLQGQEVTGYTLLTDNGGEAYYRQIVEYMQKTAAAQAVGKLYDTLEDAERLEGAGEAFEEAEKSAGDAVSAAGEAADEAADLAAEGEGEAEVPADNPLKQVSRLQRADPLTLLAGKYGVPENRVSASELCYHRFRNRGNMALPGDGPGLLGRLSGDLLFREYLMDHFPCYGDHDSSFPLTCELEYILHGAKSDRANLRWAVIKLLFLREGVNYAYLLGSPEKNGAASLLAAAILTVFDGVPGLHAALMHGLLLGWAFGESLLDVKTLLDGGSVPLDKTDESFLLDLSSLGDLGSLLGQDLGGRSEGLDYRQHLRLILYLQPVSAQIKRGLELTELNIRGKGEDSFRADNCIAAARTVSSWSVPPLFSGISAAFTGSGADAVSFETSGTFMY